jgi:hypothetical protein
MAKSPRQEFGKRRPAAVQTPTPPVKRSGHVALLVMGTVAIGAGAYAMMPGAGCKPPPPGMATPSSPPAGTDCSSRGYSSGGGHGGSWSRSNFYGGSSASSSSSSSGASSEAGSGSVTRGGFGSFAHAFSAHFSGGS